ncbi:Ctf8p and Ctf18p associating protein [Coemansia erecta]|uniref:Ctf8p and Ctf18p associating protein n=1 Tax=Coemansia erecta TaxID=147472 RepID=A0A9W8CUS6_9FUNG|nr:Ctf8p and Ctf18p associating protein [Coemansia erecta]
MASAADVFAVSASDGYPEEYRLLELTPELAAQLEAQDACTLRVLGRATDTATLVGPTEATFDLHTAHTSNNLYLLTLDQASGASNARVGSLTLRTKINQTLELQRAHAQVHARVREVLGWDVRGPFRGAEFDRADEGGRRVTDKELRANVAAGPRALQRALAEVPAFRDSQGCWRAMDAGYCVELLRLLLATQAEHMWPAGRYDLRQLHPALQADLGAALCPEALGCVLRRFGRPLAAADHPECYEIDRRCVERFLAEQIFLAEGLRPWMAADFVQALAATLPPQLAVLGPSEPDGPGGPDPWASAQIPGSLVRDLAYVTAPMEAHLLYTESGVPRHRTQLNPLFRSQLPADPRERIVRLFAAKPQWSTAEVRPFLEDLVDVDGDLLEQGDAAAAAQVAKAVDMWMIKFGRGVKSPSGVTVYTSRIN